MSKELTQDEKGNIKELIESLAQETGSHIHTEWVGDAEVMEIVPTPENGNLSLKLIYTYSMNIPSIDLKVRSNHIKYTSIQTTDAEIAYGLLISICSKHMDSILGFERVIEVIK